MWRFVDAAPCKPHWHLECNAEHFETVACEDIRRLLINVPLRHTKSLMCAVLLTG
ncbi:MAG: hypothetical protein OXG65_05775 [Chloroflexi bacterium]|nr:hypothetical protein [Chloroflexota bacterium]